MKQIGNYLSPLIKRLLRERGFTKFTEPQYKAIPLILKRKNVLIVSPTGSGKTEAAMIPIFQMMMEKKKPGIRLIYITPLRALNRDLIDRIIWWTTRLGLRISVRHGDTSVKERRLQASLPPDILITTPETFSLLLNTRVMGKHLENAEWIIIDEIHELVSNKRGAQLSINIERLNEKTGYLQRIGLSATIGNPEEVLQYLVGSDGNGDIVDVDITKSMMINVVYPKPIRKDYEDASRLYTYPPVTARIRVISDLIRKHRSTLVFTNTRPMAEILGSRLFLYDENLPVLVHHGSLSRNIRMRIERMLKEGRIKAIICTSSLELGIDIGDVDLVIQYNSPRQVSRIIQRVGRSGHWIEKISEGVIVVQDIDDMFEALTIRDMALHHDIEPVKVIEKPLDVLIHEIAGVLLKKRKIEFDELYNMLKKSYIYKNLGRDELRDLLLFASNLTDRILYYSEFENFIRRPINRKRLYDYYFSVLSMIPEVMQFIVIDDSSNSPVGILDEKFIATYGQPGTKFIIGGRPWKIIQIYRNKVYVLPEEDFFGAIPEWVGEEIPVPYEVAQKVGKKKKMLLEIYRETGGRGEFYVKVRKKLSIDSVEFLDSYYKQMEMELPIPTDTDILIEKIGDKIVIYIHGGTLVNRTLAGYLTNKVLDIYGEIIYYSSDPYRIFIRSKDLEPENLAKLLKETSDFDKYLKKIIESSNVFLWRLIHVARRMGILSKEKTIEFKDAELLLNTLRDTPAYIEAFRETDFKDYDSINTRKVLENISRGEWRIHIIDKGISPIPLLEEYLRYNEIRFEYPRLDRLKSLQILSTKAKLLNEVRTFVCLNCLEYVEEKKIKDLPEAIKCPKCGSRNIGMSDELPEDIERLLDYARERPEYIKRNPRWRKLRKTGELIEKYGKTAAFILASPNISIKDAEEILKKEDTLGGRLIQILLEYEKKNLLKRFQALEK